jgi:hypothetical protein
MMKQGQQDRADHFPVSLSRNCWTVASIIHAFRFPNTLAGFAGPAKGKWLIRGDWGEVH